MIAIIGRALLALLCAMTAPHPPVPDLPPVQPRPAPMPALDPYLCHMCQRLPRRGGSWFCGDACQRVWQSINNHIIPLEATPPGSTPAPATSPPTPPSAPRRLAADLASATDRVKLVLGDRPPASCCQGCSAP